MERGIEALVEFARIVSDAASSSDVPARLADALHEHVCLDVLVFALGHESRREARGRAAQLAIDVDIDDFGALGGSVATAAGVDAVITRPLVAGGSLFGVAVLVGAVPDSRLVLADGLVDLAAIALGSAAHVEKLERQFVELNRQQEMLVRSERLRALGQMAAGISHDLKNILNPLALHLQVVGRALRQNDLETATESVSEMKEVVERGVQTVERLRDFGRQSVEDKTELVDLERLAREAASMGKARAASSNARMPRIALDLAPAPVRALSGEGVGALVNLVANAVDALAGRDRGGTITLRSGTTPRTAWVEVADDGPGMPPEVAARVFEPFFTTKGEEGTGLGLAMVYATMQRHGGTVTVDSQPGVGTTFRLSFPSA